MFLQLIQLFLIIPFMISTLLFSIDESTSVLTSEIAVIMKQFNQTNVDAIGIPEESTLKYNKIQGDLNNTIKLKIPAVNGDISAGSLQMTFSLKAKATLAENRDYNMVLYMPNYTKIIESDNHINTKPKNFNASKYYFCNYTYSEMIYKKYSIGHNELNFIKKIERLDSLTLVLHMNNSLMVLKNTSDLVELDKDNILLNNVIDFWAVKQPDIKNLSFIILTIDYQIVTYNIEYTGDRDAIPNIILILKVVSPYKTIIHKISYMDNSLVFATGEKGLNLAIYIEGSFNQIKLLKEEVFDFIIGHKFIFCIGNEGLYIIDSSQSGFPYVLYKHNHIKQIDYVNNPFYGHLYIGLGIEQQKDDEEFFIELIVKPIERKVKINKILTGKKRSMLKYYTLDAFHSYFYDILSKELIIIRRGMLNSIPFITVKQQFDFNNPIIHLTSLYNKETSSQRLTFLTQTNMITLTDITFPTQSLNCLFKEKGTFLLRFKHLTDACYNSIVSSNELPVCQKVIDYKFEIIGEYDHTPVIIVCVLMFTALGVVGVILSVMICKKTKCCQRNTLKIKVKHSKKKRDYVYQELLDKNLSPSNELKKKNLYQKPPVTIGNSRNQNEHLNNIQDESNRTFSPSLKKQRATPNDNQSNYTNDAQSNLPALIQSNLPNHTFGKNNVSISLPMNYNNQ